MRSPAPIAAEYFCVSCRTPFLTPHPLDSEGRCALCRHGLTGFDAAYSFGSYEGTLRELIHLFKYGRVYTLAKPLAGLMRASWPEGQHFDAIVPMPMHWLRRWRRGFNQAGLLAREMSRRTAIPVLQPVRRRKATPPQAGLSNAQRRSNMAGAFRVDRPGLVKDKKLLLIDDVFTTGATASACGAALKRAGAGYVAVLTLARTDRRAFTEPLGSAEGIQQFAMGAAG